MSEEIRELGWDDEISSENKPFTLLPEADYDFTVSKVERSRYNGSEKMPACNMAKVTFTIWGPEDKVDVIENFYLNSKNEWKISALYLAIGLKKHGEPVRMQWNAVTGKRGKCRLEINKYKDKNGNDAQNNRIKRFYAYDEAEKIQTVSPAVNQPTAGGWKPGNF